MATFNANGANYNTAELTTESVHRYANSNDFNFRHRYPDWIKGILNKKKIFGHDRQGTLQCKRPILKKRYSKVYPPKF